MHMIATNLCVWLRVITIETVREIRKFVPEEIGDLLGLGDAEEGQHHSASHANVSSAATALKDHHRRAAPAASSHIGKPVYCHMCIIIGRPVCCHNIICIKIDRPVCFHLCVHTGRPVCCHTMYFYC